MDRQDWYELVGMAKSVELGDMDVQSLIELVNLKAGEEAESEGWYAELEDWIDSFEKELKEEMTISLDYGFHGSSNISVHLKKDIYRNTLVFTDYDELVGKAVDGEELARILNDLADGKYAD